MKSPDRGHERSQRCVGERGSSMVAACVLLFAFTAGGVIWLARDVNRSVSDRSAAQSIAFQAARAGAQQVDVVSLRGEAEVAGINEAAARVEAQRIAAQLFEAYELDPAGPIQIEIDGDKVTVTVTISGPSGEREVIGSAQAQVGA